jgi:serine/threonine-protein kinase
MTRSPALEPTTSPEGARSPALLSVARPGLRIGSYTLHHLVGEGGMGSVWAATQGDSDQLLALKLVRAEAASDEVIARFAREARLLFSVQHPAVARTLDAGVEEGVPYIAMELLVGRPLSNVLKREAPLPQDRAIDLFLRACVGVAVAHSHDIVHRDVKPSNFFIVPSAADGAERVCLLDFGIAKLFDSAPDGATLTQTNMALGTPGYVAPEQFRNAKQADRRADIWSLGIMLFRLLTGRSPFPADSHGEYFAKILSEAPVQLRALLPAAPEELERVIGRCLRKDPAQRFDDVLALAEALQAIAPAQSHDALAQIRALPPSILLAAPRTPVDPPSDSLEAETLTTSSLDNKRAAAPLASPAELPSLVRRPSQRRGVILLAALGALLVIAAAGSFTAGVFSSFSRSSEAPSVATVSPSPPTPSSLLSASVEVPAVAAQAPEEAAAPPSSAGSAAAPGKATPPRVAPRLAVSASGPPPASASPVPRSSKLPWSRDVNDGN